MIWKIWKLISRTQEDFSIILYISYRLWNQIFQDKFSIEWMKAFIIDILDSEIRYLDTLNPSVEQFIEIN